ncbi:LiaF transmembrane domain-containing protein [Massilia sp. S19_KUP03_FR1]|uniref:LiaF transmembrane domain-containing protein n=1 Tax=Massilia sp. S19_KUP03_FR1 TaxID=3025503 RepID=UPI002FCDAF19
MSPHISRRRSQTMVGVSLIILGTVFFLDQMDIVAMQDVWQYWPLMLVVGGLIRMTDPASPRDVSSGCWTMLIGLWLFANFEGWYGINFSNSWPALLIGWGITMLLRPVLHQRLAGRQTVADAITKENKNAL